MLVSKWSPSLTPPSWKLSKCFGKRGRGGFDKLSLRYTEFITWVIFYPLLRYCEVASPWSSRLRRLRKQIGEPSIYDLTRKHRFVSLTIYLLLGSDVFCRYRGDDRQRTTPVNSKFAGLQFGTILGKFGHWRKFFYHEVLPTITEMGSGKQRRSAQLCGFPICSNRIESFPSEVVNELHARLCN